MSAGGVAAGVLLLLVFAPCCLVLHRGHRCRWRVAADTPVVTCGRLREDSPPRVALAARTTASEVVRAPVSGEECVCYWTEFRSGTYRESDNQDTWLVERREVVGQIVVEDDTGEAIITPELAKRSLTGRRDRVVTTARTRSTVRHTYDSDHDVSETREWRVRPGVAVFVIGVPAWDGAGTPVLGGSDHPDGEGATLRSGPEAVDHLAARAARWALWTRACAVTGFVTTNVSLALILLGIG
ncbi:hypothetical protein ACRYCC_18595 [Actinomadura scrupuli]|uniref:hypothetical protein n=1 Tax=Actinomadura scrupuli TaxID=559629 RepID=UPI003D98CA21